MEDNDHEKLVSIKRQYLGYVEARHMRLALLACQEANPDSVKACHLDDATIKEHAKLAALMVTLERLFPLETRQSTKKVTP